MNGEIWYYVFPSINKILSPAYNVYEPDRRFQVIVVKKPYCTPERVWTTMNDGELWNPVGSVTFHFWWKWFKDIKTQAVIEEKISEVKLFEMIGIQNL